MTQRAIVTRLGLKMLYFNLEINCGHCHSIWTTRLPRSIITLSLQVVALPWMNVGYSKTNFLPSMPVTCHKSDAGAWRQMRKLWSSVTTSHANIYCCNLWVKRENVHFFAFENRSVLTLHFGVSFSGCGSASFNMRVQAEVDIFIFEVRWMFSADVTWANRRIRLNRFLWDL